MSWFSGRPIDHTLSANLAGVKQAHRATEHWSLLATRSLGWNEIYSRAGMFLNVLSAAVVALALVAQATDSGQGFRVFAYLVIPVVLVVGWTTYICLTNASSIDLWTIVGMNRLRNANLELAPELEPYFVAAHTDDVAGLSQTLSFGVGGMACGVASSTPLLVGTITATFAHHLLAVLALQRDYQPKFPGPGLSAA